MDGFSFKLSAINLSNILARRLYLPQRICSLIKSGPYRLAVPPIAGLGELFPSGVQWLTKLHHNEMKDPRSVLKAVHSRLAADRPTCQNPEFRSIILYHFHWARESRQSSTLGRGYASFLVRLFKTR